MGETNFKKMDRSVLVKESFGDTPYLRMLFADENKDRVYAKFKGKYFFPADRKYKKAGWVVAIIVEEQENFGFIDVVPIEEIGLKAWASKSIKGVYVKTNWDKQRLEIYPSIRKEQMTESTNVVQNCIHVIPLEHEVLNTDSEARQAVKKTLNLLKI